METKTAPGTTKPKIPHSLHRILVTIHNSINTITNKVTNVVTIVVVVVIADVDEVKDRVEAGVITITHTTPLTYNGVAHPLELEVTPPQQDGIPTLETDGPPTLRTGGPPTKPLDGILT